MLAFLETELASNLVMEDPLLSWPMELKLDQLLQVLNLVWQTQHLVVLTAFMEQQDF
jgi:hypothetical protein